VTADLLAEDPAASKVEADLAMAWLTKAVAAGYKDHGHMEKDADLAAVRGREDYKKLLKSMAAQGAK
jgi:hypothetical protein